MTIYFLFYETSERLSEQVSDDKCNTYKSYMRMNDSSQIWAELWGSSFHIYMRLYKRTRIHATYIYVLE